MNKIAFIIEEASEGGFIAKALGESIFTEVEAMKQLKANVKEAVACHFDEDDFFPSSIEFTFDKL